MIHVIRNKENMYVSLRIAPLQITMVTSVSLPTLKKRQDSQYQHGLMKAIMIATILVTLTIKMKDAKQLEDALLVTVRKAKMLSKKTMVLPPSLLVPEPQLPPPSSGLSEFDLFINLFV